MNGKAILITGGTGSFGKEFVRQALQQLSPSKLVIYSRDELKQFEMAREYTDATPDAPMRYFLGDVRDEHRLRKALKGIDLVVHAAAIKQVPAAEYNPSEAVATNIYGTQAVINACLASKTVKKVIFLSTDKAVEPCNLYGCTKAVAEKLMVNANLYSDAYPNNQKFSVVRYGNVMGSRGSVIPHFKKLADEGRNLTITHKDMTRFWISLPDAVEFVIRSIQDMKGGEIFVPKLPSLSMVELAKTIIERATCKPNSRITYTGIRPGEKLHEKLISKNERNVQTEDDRFVIMPSYNIFSDDETFPLKVSDNSFDYTSKDSPRINIMEVI